MTDSKADREARAFDPQVNLTQTLRRLTVPTEPTDDSSCGANSRALLLSRDKDAHKWGQRWLSQEGLQVELPAHPAGGLEIARELQPDVIIVDAGLRDAAGVPMPNVLADAADVTAPVIVLCPNEREVAALLDAGFHDVVRKPYNWRLVGKRAVTACCASSIRARLARTEDSLKKSLELAHAARSLLRNHQSFEPVTGLPNKTKFMDLLRRGMAAADRDGTELAACVIGFTRFRLVIEAMGQEQADLALTQFGSNLASCLNDASNLPRKGRGLRTAAAATLDQFRFALMMTCPGGREELHAFQEKLLDTLSRPIQIKGQTVYLSACVGIAIYPNDADTCDQLLQRADNAMRDAQSRGGGFRYFCAETDAAAVRKLAIEHKLHEALDQGDLRVAYQPISATGSGNVRGAEALLRWPQPDGSFISPDEFIPIAEESGLILRAGEFVLDEACRQLKEWHEHGLQLPRICVNVARAQLNSVGFAPYVAGVISKHGLKPSQLELEISERGVLSGNADVLRQLHELKELGVRLSIDDFGTGDSALSYLKDLPVDVVKIDRSYVAGMASDKRDEAIATAVATLGKRLDLDVIAEGVETREQLDTVAEMGCTEFQGYLVSEPVPADKFAAMFRKPQDSGD